MTKLKKYDIINLCLLQKMWLYIFEKGVIMLASIELIFEDMREDDKNVPILSFRNKDTDKKTPKFSIDVRNTCSYVDWEAELVSEPESLEELTKMFNDIIASLECDFVIERKIEKFSIDGDVFNGIQMFAMYFKRITFTKINLSIPERIPPKVFGARITKVVIR